MSVNPFGTQITAQAGQPGAPQALKGAAGGVFALGAGMNFWDFILGNVTASGKTGAQQPLALNANAQASANILSTEISATEVLPDETLAELLGESEIPADPLALFQLALTHIQAEQPAVETEATADLRVERLHNRIEQMSKLVEHLTAGLPQDMADQPSIQLLIARMDQRIEQLEAKLAQIEAGQTLPEDSPLMLFIAMGLSPAEITKLSERIKEVETKLGRELTVDDLIAGVANIIPMSDPQAPAQILPAAKIAASLEIADDAEPTDDLAAQLNAMNVGGGLVDPAAEADELMRPGRVSKGLEAIKNFIDGLNAAGADGKSISGIKASLNAFIAQNGAATGDITLPQGWYSDFAQSLERVGFDIHSGLPLSQTAQAAHMASMVPQAGQAHPATQLVAAHLTKAAKDGGPKSMTIQLDPPELGRVQVQMEFGPEKTVKVHVIAEKSETFLMLQRDAAMLDRALQSAGLDTDGGSLSFELAAHDNAFENDGNGGSGGGSGRDGGEDAMLQDEIPVESTMTWHVDADTGHVRYNIFA